MFSQASLFKNNSYMLTCCVHSGVVFEEDFKSSLGGGFKDVLFSPLLGEDSHFD